MTSRSKEFLGNPGERLAASLLCQAMQAQVQFATAEADDDKVDLVLDYTSPFQPKQRLHLRCQVKAGYSIGDWTENKSRYRVNLKSNFRDRLSTNTEPTLLIWIHPENNRVRYALIPPKRGSRPIYIHKSSLVTPAMLFDVARQQLGIGTTQSPALMQLGTAESIRDLLRRIRLKKSSTKFSEVSVFRNLRLTNSGLRHVTRRRRSRTRTLLSAQSMSKLPTVLRSVPLKYQLLVRGEPIDKGARQWVGSTILLTYPKVFQVDGCTFGLKVRVAEKISFPRDWQSSLLCLDSPTSGNIESSSRIMSWYLVKNG